ncbi:RnfH family protein [Azohydromonas lata]|uniref:UPF0125 protein SM757_25855 n=1 Tax=Azohydromonas lata TaxID=45677 RepID=A0ABU5IM93_9BURK|nr:RnfH family protein [Azohydromonas lata]MDZ5460010.1 RnfH family protein [Azohydromonas lata]
MQVEVVFSPAPREVDVVRLQLADGATLQQAVQESGLLTKYPHFSVQSLSFSVWGRAEAADHPLREGDRVELCRGLQVDPKEARRVRYQAQGGRRKRPA